MTGRQTVVASVMVPECSIMAASAVGPSSHGTENTRWSFADKALKPRRRRGVGVGGQMVEA